ncbi:hypothetical protein [Polaromonas sp. YR568]|uniref:hypothetical protein n=1 Tax=Polaromonas sp. YR568 TaxID=1855301 RepID=UPI000B86343F|nr:hypothetical protein [Polaromonas sp. YR568]
MAIKMMLLSCRSLIEISRYASPQSNVEKMNKPGLDRNHQVVKQGDWVRLLAIRPSILQRLAEEALADVSSMLGKTVEVFDVYDDGLVWVSLTWVRSDGTSEIHSIAVDPEAIELAPR